MVGLIQNIDAWEILDSRGYPTVRATVRLDNGVEGTASVPSGASVGQFEAVELRDGGSRFYGKGVRKAVDNIKTIIAPALKGMEVVQQELIDQAMNDLDGTPNKKKLGANAILAVSMASARAAANHLRLPLYEYLSGSQPFTMPVPLFNIINGGVHASNNLDVQEFMIAPIGVKSFSEAVECGCRVYHSLCALQKKMGRSTAVGDEGGLALPFDSTEQACDAVLEAIHHAGYNPGSDVMLALDVAASEFYKDGMYCYQGQKLNTYEWIDTLASWVGRYPILSIEDPMSDDDEQGWMEISNIFRDQVQLVGDDFFVTHQERLKEGIAKGIAQSILIKPNQVGTLTETLMTIGVAKKNNYRVIISHRSGETVDSSIADLAVAVNASQVKMGSLSRSERTEKYNRLMMIESSLNNPVYVGQTILPSNLRQPDL